MKCYQKDSQPDCLLVMISTLPFILLIGLGLFMGNSISAQEDDERLQYLRICYGYGTVDLTYANGRTVSTTVTKVGGLAEAKADLANDLSWEFGAPEGNYKISGKQLFFCSCEQISNCSCEPREKLDDIFFFDSSHNSFCRKYRRRFWEVR